MCFRYIECPEGEASGRAIGSPLMVRTPLQLHPCAVTLSNISCRLHPWCVIDTLDERCVDKRDSCSYYTECQWLLLFRNRIARHQVLTNIQKIDGKVPAPSQFRWITPHPKKGEKTLVIYLLFTATDVTSHAEDFTAIILGSPSEVRHTWETERSDYRWSIHHDRMARHFLWTCRLCYRVISNLNSAACVK